MAIMPDGMTSDDSELSSAEKAAVITRALPGVRVYWGSVSAVRALSFTRRAVGAPDVADQQVVFQAACAARGWTAGGSVCQLGGGLAAWAAVLRMVRTGGYDVVVVDSIDRIAAMDAGRSAVLGMLRREGVRLLAAHDGIDTGDPIGADLVGSLVGAARVAVAR
ncbi:recombinase family protein [Pseudofrankia sp. BMG5.37]|uniref:recombinase family protein n=1 Tax=Pseudofrankia sp. BMG5.37 TaxID=3050035 RepID=UPI002895899D|nr:recombinase family protein [Pseudofrankia sp. BMG5.37]MDT3440982.1 recombinase family protein [Pseudofrankia sp. BMG5.37]